MKTIEGIEFWSFVEEPAELSNNPSLCNGETIKDWLDEKYQSGCSFGIDNLTEGFYRLGGWCFDLRPYMKKYIFTDYDYIRRGYAPNIKGLRKVFYLRKCEKVALAPKGF